jgi:hypothetical protein
MEEKDVGIQRGTRFTVPFEVAFPNGLVQVGDVAPDNEYQPDKSRPARQNRDEVTGKLQWKVTVTDPSEKKAKRASFDLVFLADHQPVPSTPELAAGTGMRLVELAGLSAEPRVMGQGEFKYLGFIYRAEGYREAGREMAGKPAAGTGNSGAKVA